MAIAAMAVALWAYEWARWVSGDADRYRSEWWTNTTAVLLPGSPVSSAAVSEERMWTALALLVFAGICVALWIGRIGSNLRQSAAPFGMILPITALPAWWLLLDTIGLTEQPSRTRSDQLLRALAVLAVILAQFVLVRWSTLNRIWRAGHLPADQLSLLLWIPMMIPWLMYYGSLSYTLMILDEAEPISNSDWRPTEAMLDWAHWLTRGTWVAIVILLIVVSVRQHTGLARDRANDATARLR